MRIVVLCATQRGLLFIKKLAHLAPDAELFVFSFREEPWEPPFLQNIKVTVLSIGGQFFETRNIGGHRWNTFWNSTPVDLMLVVSWRYLLPSEVYCRPRLGSFAFHDSLLPQYRGFSPTIWAIINGEDHTGDKDNTFPFYTVMRYLG